MKPGPYTARTVKEIFIDGTQPTQADNTKVGVEVDEESGLLWQEGCVGPKKTKGFLDLSGGGGELPAVAAVQPGLDRPREEGFRRPRRSGAHADQLLLPDRRLDAVRSVWGAPFAPTKTCDVAPTPTEEPFPTDDTGFRPDGAVRPVPVPRPFRARAPEGPHAATRVAGSPARSSAEPGLELDDGRAVAALASPAGSPRPHERVCPTAGSARHLAAPQSRGRG